MSLLLCDLQKILIEAKQLDKQFCSWFASDCILTNLSTVISHVMVDEYRLQEPSTEVVPAAGVGSESMSDYEDAIAVNDDGDEIDFPPPTGTFNFVRFSFAVHAICSKCIGARPRLTLAVSVLALVSHFECMCKWTNRQTDSHQTSARRMLLDVVL